MHFVSSQTISNLHHQNGTNSVPKPFGLDFGTSVVLSAMAVKSVNAISQRPALPQPFMAQLYATGDFQIFLPRCFFQWKTCGDLPCLFLVFLLSVCCAVVLRFGKVGIQKNWTNPQCFIYIFFLKLLWVSTRLGWIFWKVDSPSVEDDNIASMVKQKNTSCTALKLTNVYKCDQPNHRHRVFLLGKRTPMTWWLPCTPLPKFKLGALQKRPTPYGVFASWFPKSVAGVSFRVLTVRTGNTGWCLDIFVKMGSSSPNFRGEFKKQQHVKPLPIEYHQISTCILTSTPFHQWYSSCKCLAIWVLVATGLHRYRQRWDSRRNPDPTCHVSHEIASTCHGSQGF